MIPTNVIKADDQSPLTLVIYGKPKIGKTELVAALTREKKFLIMDFEDGSNHVDAMRIKILGFYPPAKENPAKKEKRQKEGEYYFQEFGQELLEYRREKGENPYNGAIVDTITALEEWCEEDGTWEYMATNAGRNFNRVIGQQGLSKEGEVINVVPKDNFKSVLTLPSGAGYLHLRNSFKKWKGKFDKIAKYKVFIAHVKDIYLEKDGKEVSASDLDLTGKIKNITCASVDAIGRIYRTSEKPLELRISFVNDNQDLVGSRAKHLRNKDFVIAINNEDGSIKEHFWDKVYI
jgi:hypothetical protein